MIVGLLAWAIRLWQRHEATVGDVVLVCTLGISVLSATRDFAVALVDVTQHFARLSEALVTLLSPHELTDHPQAAALAPKGGASIVFERISFAYAGDRQVFDQFTLAVEPGQKVGLVGPSGGGKSTLLALLQRFYDLPRGRILIDGHDISRATQESLRQAIAVVPQDARAAQPFADGEHPLRPSGSDRCGGLGARRSPRDAANSSRTCRRASIRSSATAALNCPAVSVSASRSLEPS